jgi:hypothetical protein
MTITIGYDLPFQATAFTTPDDALRIRIRCKPGTRSKGLLQIQTHVAIFLEAALFGMGAGERIPPRLDRRTIDDVMRVTTSDADHETVLEAPVVVDPSYVTVLLHKLLGLSALVAILEVAVELPGLGTTREPVPIHRGACSELPAMHLPLPFTLVDERTGNDDGCTLSLRLVEPPTEPQLEILRDGLRVWLAQALQGGFIQPPMGPDDYFVSADDIEVHDDEVTWVLENDDIAQDGINGVVSFLAAYHHQVAALRELLIE